MGWSQNIGLEKNLLCGFHYKTLVNMQAEPIKETTSVQRKHSFPQTVLQISEEKAFEILVTMAYRLLSS